MSIMRETAEKQLHLHIHLIYGSRDPSDIIYAGEIKRLEAECPSIRADFVISEPPEGWGGLCGMLDAVTIHDLIGSVEGKAFFICGPNQMYGLCADALGELGVPARLVRREVYGPPRDVTAEEGWPGGDPARVFKVREERSGREFDAPAGEPLMNSLERAGLELNAVCRAGECTWCRTRLVVGQGLRPGAGPPALGRHRVRLHPPVHVLPPKRPGHPGLGEGKKEGRPRDERLRRNRHRGGRRGTDGRGHPGPAGLQGPGAGAGRPGGRLLFHLRTRGLPLRHRRFHRRGQEQHRQRLLKAGHYLRRRGGPGALRPRLQLRPAGRHPRDHPRIHGGGDRGALRA